ncbi:MAG TPA: Crp/Fnr family transcriptional regulator [Nitrospirae bacterium]|nr:Crp/Fnr family transcriptional regulator [Nitrospirota bacterium]
MKPDSPFYPHTLKALKESALFGNLAKPVIQDMLLSFRMETWRSGATIMDPEETVRRFYVLISGRVKITRTNPDTGREFILFLLGSGDGFDVVSLLDGKKHNIAVVAMDDLEVLSSPIDTIHDWIEKHPEFNKAFLPYLGQQLRQISELASDLALHDTETRLAKLFLQHTTQSSNPHPGLKLIYDFSHEELASMIGSVRTVVNRHLQEFKREGIITARRGHVEVNELHALGEKLGEHLRSRGKR